MTDQACEPEQWYQDEDEIDRELAEREEAMERDRNPQAYGEHPAECDGRGCDMMSFEDFVEQQTGEDEGK